jgi:two-component system response regulator NreC
LLPSSEATHLSPELVEVLLVDSRTVVRQGLRALIDTQPDLLVVGQAGTLQACRAVGVTPRVVVTEIDLPDARHEEAVTGLRALFPSSSILVLTTVGHPAKVCALLAAGANGYVLKTSDADQLFLGIREVGRGEAYLQPSLEEGVEAWAAPPDPSRPLSPREEDVLRLLALGHTNAEIASEHGVSVRTVETQRSRIYDKLGCHTRAGAVQQALELGMLSVG